jgi:protein-disulfide isomerase
VARALPAERYEPFIDALFASQDRWAFAQGVNSTEEIWKMAALAGMSRSTFDKAVADSALKNWIQTQQVADEKMYNIEATPTFLINGKAQAGDMSYDEFVSAIGLTG